MPGSPLWNLAKGRYTDAPQSVGAIQKAIDHLTCKARLQQPFTADEKEFSKELFEALWWGGHALGYREAAQLANHYVNGNGKIVHVDSQVYQTSRIVADTAAAMKQHLASLLQASKPIPYLRSNDPGFLRSSFALGLAPKKRGASLGYLRRDGALLAEQGNARLKNCDHRFILQALLKQIERSRWLITWRVESTYDFEPFDRESFETDIPVKEGTIVRLPDGLSEYLTHVGVATAFQYWAQWDEPWQP